MSFVPRSRVQTVSRCSPYSESEDNPLSNISAVKYYQIAYYYIPKSVENKFCKVSVTNFVGKKITDLVQDLAYTILVVQNVKI